MQKMVHFFHMVQCQDVYEKNNLLVYTDPYGEMTCYQIFQQIIDKKLFNVAIHPVIRILENWCNFNSVRMLFPPPGTVKHYNSTNIIPWKTLYVTTYFHTKTGKPISCIFAQSFTSPQELKDTVAHEVYHQNHPEKKSHEEYGFPEMTGFRARKCTKELCEKNCRYCR